MPFFKKDLSFVLPKSTYIPIYTMNGKRYFYKSLTHSGSMTLPSKGNRNEN